MEVLGIAGNNDLIVTCCGVINGDGDRAGIWVLYICFVGFVCACCLSCSQRNKSKKPLQGS